MAEIKENVTKKVTASKPAAAKIPAATKPPVKKAEKAEVKVALPKAGKAEVKKPVAKVEKTESKQAKTEVKAVKETAPKTEKQPEVKAPAKKAVKAKTFDYMSTGKRKTSVARIRVYTGTGRIIVNDRDIEEYFNLPTLITLAKQPLVLTNTDKKFDIVANIYGGGFTGQAGALRHAITKALVQADEQLRDQLKKAGFLTRDARIKERKKYGLKKARKASQFSKR